MDTDNPVYALIALAILGAITIVGIEYDPATTKARVEKLVSRANELQDSGSDKAARTYYRQALDLDPLDSDALTRIAMSHYLVGDFADAADYWLRAVHIQPDDAPLRNNLGLAYSKMPRYEAGIEHFQEAIRLDPKTTRYANNFATLYVDSGDDANAVAALSAAHGDQAVVHFNMAHLYSKRDRIEDAKEQLRASLAVDPNLGRASDLLAKLESTDP